MSRRPSTLDSTGAAGAAAPGDETCPTAGAVFPAGVSTRLLVYALGNNAGNAANGVQKVELFVDESTTPIVATAVSGQPNYYEAPFTIPAAAAANSTISIRAVVTNASGLSEQMSTSLTVIVADRTITAISVVTPEGEQAWAMNKGGQKRAKAALACLATKAG